MSDDPVRILLADAAATEALGAALARALTGQALVVFLRGDLGAGKTTLARGLLQALGHTGAVRSPTYTLMEPYDLAIGRCLHLDLYRMVDAEELEYLGLREEVGQAALLLVEWPEQGGELLPPADLRIDLADEVGGTGRVARLRAESDLARALLHRLNS